MSAQSNQLSLATLSSLCKRRGFVFQTSEIYGGLTSSYDYGHVGTLLLRNIKNAWWDFFVNHRDDIYGLDSQILLHPKTWIASGHVESFCDPLVEDKKTNKRYRADHIIEEWLEKNPNKYSDLIIEDLDLNEMNKFIKDNKILSPEGNELTEAKEFNILFESAIGSVKGEKSKIYLRGETAQGIFTNFKQIVDTERPKLPFGIGQIGKSFRNEITTGQFTFRTLEFEQAEIEYFFDPKEMKWQDVMSQWKALMDTFLNKKIGLKRKNYQWRKHTDQERSHYSKETYDLDYNYCFGTKELWGLAYRTDYDLKTHMKHSGSKLQFRTRDGKKIIPHVMEPAIGINRLFLAVLNDAYRHNQKNKRTYLKFAPHLAPYQAAIFPLLRNKKPLVQLARQIYDKLRKKHSIVFDDRGNIGKRYMSQDEIGTPYCITIDFDTLDDNTVTIRDRNTTQQKRIDISKLDQFIEQIYN